MLRQELGSYLLLGFKFEVPGIASISRVVGSKDLKSAKVYVSVMGSDSEREQALELINEHRVEFQNHISKAIDLRFCPRLTFFLDEAAEKMLKVEQILYDLEQNREKK
jgi:ribosome-binding factor A